MLSILPLDSLSTFSQLMGFWRDNRETSDNCLFFHTDSIQARMHNNADLKKIPFANSYTVTWQNLVTAALQTLASLVQENNTFRCKKTSHRQCLNLFLFLSDHIHTQ